MKSLQELSESGYCIDEWRRWQQGYCLEYAHALLSLNSSLRLGVLDSGNHFFAHDSQYAYDSAGRHELPYMGVHGDMSQSLDQNPDWYDIPDDDEFPDAISHIIRNHIL